jgi:hypothetical protein
MTHINAAERRRPAPPEDIETPERARLLNLRTVRLGTEAAQIPQKEYRRSPSR